MTLARLLAEAAVFGLSIVKADLGGWLSSLGVMWQKVGVGDEFNTRKFVGITIGDGMAREKVLVVDDEDDIRELLETNLRSEGYTVVLAATGEAALEIALREDPDLVLLDLMLPGSDGFDICRMLKSRAETSHIPIVMLTARGEEADIVAGLEVGAEDYITKPFSPRVLKARIKNVLRRRKKPPVSDTERINVHEIVIHPGRHEVLIRGEQIALTPTEFKLLHFLAKHPGWVFTRYQIVDAVKGLNTAVTDRSVDVQVVALRKKLADAGQYIETVRGVGYRFKE